MMFASFAFEIHPMTLKLLYIMYGENIPLNTILDAAMGDGWIIIPGKDCVIRGGRINKKHYEDGNNYSE